MEWHNFLREERNRKISSIDMLSEGRISISINNQDVSPQVIADHQKHIAEIESILTAAGESF
jgi:hypothetical protein